MNINLSSGYVCLIAAAVLAACTKDPHSRSFPSEDRNNRVYAFEAVQADSDPSTRTVIKDGTAVYWSPNDSVNIFYGTEAGGKFIGANTEVTARTTFNGTFSTFDGSIDIGMEDTYFWGVYPYRDDAVCDGGSVSVVVPAEQTATEGSFAPGLFPAVAKSSGLALAFYNVCGGIMFTVSQGGITSVTFNGNNGENIAGSAKVGMDEDGKPQVSGFTDAAKTITVTAPGEGSFKPGVKYYIVAYPAVLSNGFSLTYNKMSTKGTFTSSTAVSVRRSVFAKLEGKDADISFVPKVGANCFIISKYGINFFDCTRKGNSDEPVGEIASAEVLWESFGTGTAPSVGGVVSGVSCSNGRVSFKANADGNAVIVVKDASGNILWSWHIWVCKDFDPKASAQVYNNGAGTMMDRNLGATSSTPGDVKALGLLYQWGRKDPFLSGDKISYSSSSNQQQAASTLSWPPAVSSDESNGTMAYAVAHPTTFITRNDENFDWYYTGSSSTDNTRWQISDKEKGMYDPCPAGWRVPDGGPSGVWSTAFGSGSYWRALSKWDSASKGMDFGKTDSTLGTGTIWYPAAGCRIGDGGLLGNVGDIGLYWSCTPYDSKAHYLYFSYFGYVLPSNIYYRAYGRSVRCISE